MDNARIILKGGTVVRGGESKVADVAIKGSCVECIAAEIVPTEGDMVVDCRGRIVVAGLVDLHVHLRGSNKNSSEDCQSFCQNLSWL